MQSLMHRVQCQMGILQFHLNAKTHVPLLGVLTSTIAGPQLSLLPVQILSVYLYAPLGGGGSPEILGQPLIFDSLLPRRRGGQ